MKSFEIEKTKEYLNLLFSNNKFDSFYLYEARIKSEINYYISGRINKDYFDSEDDMLQSFYFSDIKDEFVCFGKVKEKISSVIEKKIPKSMKLVLMFNNDNIERLIEMNNLPLSIGDVSNLTLNFILEEGKAIVTTGTAMKIFTLDKSLEQLWDRTVEKYYI